VKASGLIVIIWAAILVGWSGSKGLWGLLVSWLNRFNCVCGVLLGGLWIVEVRLVAVGFGFGDARFVTSRVWGKYKYSLLNHHFRLVLISYGQFWRFGWFNDSETVERFLTTKLTNIR
jgi:hypothetical protein